MARRPGATPATAPTPWWQTRRAALLRLMRDGAPRYVYHLPTVRAQARRLRETLTSVDGLYYAMKANGHPAILAALGGLGVGLECVSLPEVERARATLGPKGRILFTPNLCPLAEYEAAAALGAEIVVDGPEPLLAARRFFAGREIGLRLDPGRGQGHHAKVRTAGTLSKFGHPIDAIDPLLEAADAVGAKATGLHAHVGSGVFDSRTWARTARALLTLRPRFPALAWMSLGGGLGVPAHKTQRPLDLAALEKSLRPLRRELADVTLRLEPGRFFVAEAGVLLAPVTQVRKKGSVTFVGVATGMNSLMRPALYGAYHEIVNLTRLAEPASELVTVAGPLCESGDILGRDRRLPHCEPGDVLLIEHGGAYGAVMSSHYNLRAPAAEVILKR